MFPNTLPSGVVAIIYNYDTSNAFNIYFDVDGVKGPSKKGVDIFNAFIVDDGLDVVYNSPSGENLSPDYAALSWVLSIGNMDYLHCNDLNWSTKHQCD